MARRGASKEKVLAIVVYLLEHSLIRIGNREYVDHNNSYGLTTLMNRHVNIRGANIQFNFLGKSGVRHNIEIHDPRLARLIQKVRDLPGQELFQYLNDDGTIGKVSSSDVNDYLRAVTGEHITAKDFRTWWGTVLALTEFSKMERPSSVTAAKRTVTSVMKTVSKRLGNTAAICRKCYVHPAIVAAYHSGVLHEILIAGETDDAGQAELALLRLLDEI